MGLSRYTFIFALVMAAQGQRSFAQTGATSQPPLGVVWQWQTEGLEDSSTYTIEFLPDGHIAIRADCNRGRASFETFGENRLRIGPVATTRAACPPGSLGSAFLEQVVSSSSYALEGERLVLYPVVAPGTVVFTPVSPEPPSRTVEFTCTPPDEAAFTFSVKFGPGEVRVTLPARFGGRSLVLPQARAASGARFEVGGVVFWNKGDEALLQVDNQTFEGCEEGLEP